MNHKTIHIGLVAWFSISYAFPLSSQDVVAEPGDERLFEQLTHQLTRGTEDPYALNAWSDLALTLNKFELWKALKQGLNLDAPPAGSLTPHAHFLLSWELDTIKWSGFSKLAQVKGIEAVQWHYAKAVRAEWLEASEFTSNSDKVNEGLQAIEPIAESSIRLATGLTWSLIVLVLSFLTLGAMNWRSKSQNKRATTLPIIDRLKHLLQDTTQSNQYQIALSELELFLMRASIERSLGKDSAWHRLSEKQRLLLYLIVQGHAAQDCAEYLQISVGHLYNQRSELRKLFGIKDGDSFDCLFHPS